MDMDNGVGTDCGSWGQAGWRGTKRKNGTSVTAQTIKHQNEKKDFFNSVKTHLLFFPKYLVNQENSIR